MKKIICKIIATALLMSLCLCALPVYATEAQTESEIPHIPYDSTIPQGTAYDGYVSEYSGQAALDAGVPAGFDGSVLKLTPKTDPGHAGVCVDYSEQSISIDAIESITFRIYIPAGGSSEFRIRCANYSGWVVQAAPSAFSAWVDVVLTENSGFKSGCNMNTLANEDGNLGAFCMIFRLKDITNPAAYIDSVDIKLKSEDGVDRTAPVITYSGEKTVKIKEGESFTPGTATAYDEFDGAAATVETSWSDGAFGSDGLLTAGIHTYTIKATDLAGNVAVYNVTVIVESDDPSTIALDNLPIVDYIEGISPYDGNVQSYTASEAAAAGVPGGYEGNVIKVTGKNSNYMAVTLDMTSLAIPIHLIDSITFRVYLTSGSDRLRINNAGYENWLVLQTVNYGTWIEYTIRSDGTGLSTGRKLWEFKDENGNLGIFGIATKGGSGLYVDGITIKLKADDGKAPVLNYNGKTDILTSCGKTFDPGATAYDEQEQRDIELAYTWSEGALDSEGKMLEGVHTCRISATDYYGNTSYVDLNVTVGPPDVTAPEISFRTSKVYVAAGTYYRMAITATDDYDDVTVVEEWSEGAIDLGGRLNEGTHTLTLTATDLSGNKTVHVVTFYVLSTDVSVGPIVQCGK